MPRPAALFDLDGTLCDTSAIVHLIDGEEPDYHAFHAASARCPARPEVVEAARRAREDGRAVLVVTSREFIWRDLTLDWLARQSIQHDGLYMRYASDVRPAVVVKAELLAQLRDDGFEPVEAWEDHPDILQLWRESGIVTLHDTSRCLPHKP
ncbi:HAD family acid phosphatase [uncultured Aeromicrobium sp.]|uniref:phosphatase domain-containing protein n=1 Tax=uncultured Aeromicrobium sp. TaxID=337820 RepID=UPI0025FA115B|nr:HAD family acid phosphatase [uncultured Aeromicrobium sp.]